MHRLMIESANRAWRIIVHPEGGYCVERYVRGPGWVLDNDAASDRDVADTLAVAGLAVEKAMPAALFLCAEGCHATANA